MTESCWDMDPDKKTTLYSYKHISYLLTGSQDSPAVDLDCKLQHQARGKHHALGVILCAAHFFYRFDGRGSRKDQTKDK